MAQTDKAMPAQHHHHDHAAHGDHAKAAFGQHDHVACVDTALAAADATCAARGLQFTPVRRRVLEILLEAHEAMGAYDILARLDAEGMGSKPPVAYRALAFLVDNGFVHRIERLNAFIACSHPGATHAPAFMICRQCGTVAEAEAAPGGPLAASAAATGFRVEQTVIEIEGLCPACQKAGPAPAAHP
jgi:Fur family transcriptional regulator, zinc uptake regulator